MTLRINTFLAALLYSVAAFAGSDASWISDRLFFDDQATGVIRTSNGHAHDLRLDEYSRNSTFGQWILNSKDLRYGFSDIVRTEIGDDKSVTVFNDTDQTNLTIGTLGGGDIYGTFNFKPNPGLTVEYVVKKSGTRKIRYGASAIEHFFTGRPYFIREVPKYQEETLTFTLGGKSLTAHVAKFKLWYSGDPVGPVSYKFDNTADPRMTVDLTAFGEFEFRLEGLNLGQKASGTPYGVRYKVDGQFIVPTLGTDYGSFDRLGYINISSAPGQKLRVPDGATVVLTREGQPDFEIGNLRFCRDSSSSYSYFCGIGMRPEIKVNVSVEDKHHNITLNDGAQVLTFDSEIQ